MIEDLKSKFLFRQRVELREDILQFARACIVCSRFVWRLFHDEGIARAAVDLVDLRDEGLGLVPTRGPPEAELRHG